MRCQNVSIVLAIYIASRADTKSRLNEFITWGEEIILESADLFLVGSLAATVWKLRAEPPPIGSGDLASGL